MCVYQGSVESLPRPGELVCLLQLCFPSPLLPPATFDQIRRAPFPVKTPSPVSPPPPHFSGASTIVPTFLLHATLFRELPKVRKGEKHNTNLGHGRSPPPPDVSFSSKNTQNPLYPTLPLNDSRYASERDKIFPPLTLSKGFCFSFF